MFTKFAAFEVISAVMVPSSTSQDSANSMVRTAHKAVFDYEVRPGYLYVRSRAISSRCNDNFDEFPAEEIKTAYKTFIGKPVFVNHNNDNHRRARGVCIDAVLHEDTLPDGRPDTWAEVLMEVDAVNFPKLAEAILKGHIERTSMGTDVKYSICSICSNKATSPAEYCQHIPRQKGQRIYRADPKTGVKEGILIREICYGLSFFENSLLVEPPADPTAFFTGVDTRGVTKAASKTAADNPVFLAPKFEDFGSEDSYDDEEDYEGEPRKNKGQGSAYRPSWQTRRRALWRNRLKSAISEHGVSWIPFMNEMKATSPGINNQRLLGHYHRMLKQDPDNFHAFVQGIADNSSSGKTSSKIAKIKTYWHVSPEDFSRGDTIKPAAETGKGGHWGFDYPKDKVYLSKDFDDAHHWAHLLHQRLRLSHGEEHEPQNVHIYEVEAPESSRHPMHESTTGYEFKAPHARVVNRETTVYADDDVDPDGSGWLQSNCDHCGEPWFEKEVGARKTAGLNPRTAAFVQRVQANLSKVAEETADNSYGWAHRPGTSDDGIPAWDLTQNVPADVYTHPHYYSNMSEPSNREAHNILGRIRNNPEAKVHIYRSLPAEAANHGIKPGDWVSISKEYARQHGKQEDPKDDWPVIRATVKAKDLFTDADDFREFGFWGEKPVVHGIHFKGGKNQEVSVRSDGSIRAVQRRNQTQASVVDFFHQATDNDLFQFFAEGVDPFLRVKATAETELNKAVSKHDAVIQEAERPLESARGDARLEWEAAYEKMRQAKRKAQEKLDPHDAVRKESQHKADDKFASWEDHIKNRIKEAYAPFKPHEQAHASKINDLRSEYYTEENKHRSRRRDALDANGGQGFGPAYEKSVGQAHQDFENYKTKHNKAVDDANAELEPHKKVYEARREAFLAYLQPHKDKRDAAYAAAENVFAPHRQEYKRAVQVADDAVDGARKVWRDKVEAAQQEHEDSGRADVVRREHEKRNVTFSRFYTQMRNAPHPRNLEYKFHNETRHGEDDMHEVSVHHDGQEVGHVRWANDNYYERDRHHMPDEYGCDNCGDTFNNFKSNEDDESICPHCEEEGTVYDNDSDEDSSHGYFPGEIGYIHVDHAYRRHGIATGLVQAARDAHDDGDATTRAEHSDNKTAEGRAWHERMVEKDPKMASLLQFFAEGTDPFLRVKATAETELDKASKKHDAVIEEAERPKTLAEDAARAEFYDVRQKMVDVKDQAADKLRPHDEILEKSKQKADDEFAPHEDRIKGKINEAYAQLKPHEKAHESKIQDLRNGYYTEENKHRSRLRDALDANGGERHGSEYLESVRQIHQDFDDYEVKHRKAVNDANAELEPHKQAYNARHEALLAELKPHEVTRALAYEAAGNARGPHLEEYKRAVKKANETIDEARKVWSDKADAAGQEHFDSGRADIVHREHAKRAATFSRFYTQMRNAPHPKNLEYKFYHQNHYGDEDMHQVSVHHNGEEVGHIRWANNNHDERDYSDVYACDSCGDTFNNYKKNEDGESICPSCEENATVYDNDDEDGNHFAGEIGYIHVNPAYQRHGIGTNLVKKAREFYESGDASTRAEHSSNKTPQGRAWHQRMVEKDPKMASLIQHFAVKVNEGLFWESPDDRHEVHIEKQGPNHVVRLDDNLTGESHYPTRGANDQLNLGDKLEGLPNEVRHSLVNALEIVHNDAEAKQHERGAQVPSGEVAHHENDFKQEDLNLWREKQIKKWLEDEIHLSSSLLQHFAPIQHFGAKDFDLNDVKLKYSVGHYLSSKMHHLEAFHDGNKIGYLKWALEPNDYEAPGEIAGVDVDKEHRNKGVATKMFLEAHDMWRRGEVKERPYHSYQSDAAEDWIDSLRKKNPEFGVTRYDLDEKYPDAGEDYSEWHKSALLQHFAVFQRKSVVEYNEDYDQPTDDMADNVPNDGYLAAREKHNRKIEKQREKNVGILFDADAEYNGRKLDHDEELSNLNHEFVSALQPHRQKLGDAEEAYKPHLKALRESVEKNWEDHPDDQRARDAAQVSISAAHQPHQDAIDDARAEYTKRESEVRASFMPRSDALRAELADHTEVHQQAHQKANDAVRDLMGERKKDLTENHPPQLRFEHDYSGRLDLNGWVMKAYHGNRHIGELHWSDGSDPDKYQKGEIAWIGVHPKYRNVGVATEMMRKARQHGETPGVARPEHSDNRTDMGMGWHQRLVEKDPTLASLRATGSAIWSSEDPRSDFYEGPKPEPDSHEGVDDPFLNARRKALHDYQAKAKPLLNEGADLREKRRKLHQWHTRAANEILKKKGPTPIYERVPELVDLDEKYQSKISPLWVKQHENADAHTRVVGDYTKALRAAPSPENVTHHFSYDANNDHHVVAMHHGKKVGYLKWNDEADGYHGDGEIKMIEVHPDYQRHGIATNMMKYARDLYDSGEVGQNPEHSNDRTDDGDAWISQLPSSLSLLQHFANDEDPFLTIKKQEDAKLQAVRHGSEEEWSNAWKTYIQNMRNAPHPKNVEYKFHYVHGDDMHAVTAHHNGEEVGHLRWADDTHGDFANFTGYFPGEISNIDVDPEYQRRGIATKMMERAREAGNSREANTRPEHSGSRTPAGNAWINSLPPSLSLLQYFADYAMYVNLHDGDKEVTMDPVHEKQVQTHEEIPVTELWKRAPLASLNSHLLDHFNDTAVYSKKTSLKTLDLVYSMKEEDNNA